MLDSTDHVTPKLGLSLSIQLNKIGSGLNLCAVVLENLNSAVSGTTMTIYKADGVTPLMYRAIGKMTDSPIRSIQ